MNVPETVYHVPVMLNQSVDGLSVRKGGVYVDVTFGGGGHSREILRRMDSDGRLFGFDQDGDAAANVPQDGRFTFVLSNFRYIENWMDYYGISGVDGVLADLGVSSHHFDDVKRGFSFRHDAELDMRMNRKSHLTAAEVLNTYDEERLAFVLHTFGELKNARQIARAVIKRRNTAPFARISDLLELLQPFVGRDREKKDMAKAFQALRMEVNDETGALCRMLEGAISLLVPGGRLVVLTYHSIEDRIVKNYIRSGNAAGKVEQDFYGNRLVPLKAVNNKVIVPAEEEIERNPRSRSAKLRIAEKII
jgi:16S rRNA (cytosine1402-N4)-methyltransferase